jgi:hypothetical protein
VRSSFDGSGYDPDGAFFGIALLEKLATRIQFADEDLAGQRCLVVLLHAIERRKLAQHRHVDRASLTH